MLVMYTAECHCIQPVLVHVLGDLRCALLLSGAVLQDVQSSDPCQEAHLLA